MDILLDTCTVLWYFNGDESIPQATREIILNPENAIYVSLATIWEISIKISIGRLSIDGDIDGLLKAIDDEDFLLLDITTEHIKTGRGLPFIHRDPFDRMLIAQTIVEDFLIMTTDSEMLKYNISPIWAP